GWSRGSAVRWTHPLRRYRRAMTAPVGYSGKPLAAKVGVRAGTRGLLGGGRGGAVQTRRRPVRRGAGVLPGPGGAAPPVRGPAAAAGDRGRALDRLAAAQQRGGDRPGRERLVR